MASGLQSEITVEVKCSKKKLFEILKANGFLLKERLYITDYYYTHLDVSKKHPEFKELSKNSCLIRNVELERRYFNSGDITTLLYKKKDIDENNHTLSEQKVACKVDSLASAKRILSLMGLNNWCTKKITGHVFKSGPIELLVQEVDGFGLFIEVEQFESQANDSQTKIMNRLKKFINELEIPIRPDYHVSISYLMYLESLKPKKPKTSTSKSAPKKAGTSKPKTGVRAKTRRS
ncbi:MAG: hypothetical protein LBG88_00235 [Christensenellaceae bacterium]|nr:hypothetical protein [Christensenellaceae bacterium]